MVLDNTSDSDGFAHDAPPSDRDPYSSEVLPSAHSIASTSDLSLYPRSFPVLGPLFGYNDKTLSKAISTHINEASKILDRSLNQDEVSGVAYWLAKQRQIESYGVVLGVGGGLWSAFKHRASFRFPFYQPNLATFPSQFFPATRMAMVSGPRAMILWHLTRCIAYSFVWSTFGRSLFGGYGAIVAAIGHSDDKRVRDLYKELRKLQHQSQISALPGQTKGTAVVKGPQQTDAARDWRRGEPGRVDEQYEAADDASPTTGYDEPRDTGVFFELEASASKPYHGMQPVPQPQSGKTQGINAQGKAQQDSSTGLDRSEKDPRASQSAWERIRQKSGSAAPGGPPTTGQASAHVDSRELGSNKPTGQSSWTKLNSPNSEENYAFSSAEEERQLAKGEAQKEFDARIEKERRGGDFGGNSGDQKRW